MTLSEYSVISRAVEHYGVNSQINMLFEEMSELQNRPVPSSCQRHNLYWRGEAVHFR